jgi:hypothetical protein
MVNDGWAQLTPDVSLPTSPPPSAVTITATHEAPIIGGALFNIGPFQQTATATAQVVLPTALPNPPFTNSAYITPIVVNECIFAGNCFGGQVTSTCFSSPGCHLNLDTDNRPNSLFGIAVISPGSSIGRSTFRRWMQCAGCAPGPIGTQATGPLSRGTSGSQALTGMNSTVGKTLIFPVFDNFDGTNYNIVGFSAFVVTTSSFWYTPGGSGTPPTGNWQPQSAACAPDCKVIDGYFLTNYTLPTRLVSNGGSGSQDFGVRAIALTS